MFIGLYNFKSKQFLVKWRKKKISIKLTPKVGHVIGDLLRDGLVAEGSHVDVQIEVVLPETNRHRSLIHQAETRQWHHLVLVSCQGFGIKWDDRLGFERLLPFWEMLGFESTDSNLWLKNVYLSLSSKALSIIRIWLAQCEDNVTEWDIRSWCWPPDLPVGQHYEVATVCTVTSRYLSWYDHRCCQAVKPHQPTITGFGNWRTCAAMTPLHGGAASGLKSMTHPHFNSRQ